MDVASNQFQEKKYLSFLDRLSSKEIQQTSEKWKQAGYCYAPAMVQTVQKLEEAIHAETGKSHVFLFDRDMSPFTIVKDTWGGDKNIDYTLIPASSSVFGVGWRNAIDESVSWLRNGSTGTWDDRMKQLNETIAGAIKYTYDDKPKEMIAFCRNLMGGLGVNSGKLTDDEIGALLLNEKGRSSMSRLQASVDHVVLFDCARVGTYMEMTQEILHRLFPDLKVRGAMLNTYNPRVANMTDGIFDFEHIPKGYDIFSHVVGDKIKYPVRSDPRGTWSAAFSFGLRVGVEELTGKSSMTYDASVTPPEIPLSHAEKQWAWDFDTKQEDKMLNLTPWHLKDGPLSLGDFKMCVNGKEPSEW